jgi:hypothetical protein
VWLVFVPYGGSGMGAKNSTMDLEGQSVRPPEQSESKYMNYDLRGSSWNAIAIDVKIFEAFQALNEKSIYGNKVKANLCQEVS